MEEVSMDQALAKHINALHLARRAYMEGEADKTKIGAETKDL